MSNDKSGKDGDKLLYCSFCGKSQQEVRKLIAGPSVYVCDECVELCNDIIKDEINEDEEMALILQIEEIVLSENKINEKTIK